MPLAVVTGAFSNTGAAVASELGRRGWSIRTLTNRVPPAGHSIPVFPLRFDRAELERPLAGADALINTYWVRFPHGDVTFERAVGDSRVLIDAARSSGVRRLVHVGVSNASESCPLGYYRGKAAVDRSVRESGLSYAIVRPTLVVGAKDVLTNNVAWFLRRFPVFAVPGGRGYRLQPVLRDDVARIVADAVERTEPIEVDAAGPEIVTFDEYVHRLAAALGVCRGFVTLPPPMVIAGLRIVGTVLRDTVLTPEELEGLRADLLVSRSAPLGTSSVFDWLSRHAAGLGRRYVNDTLPRFATRARVGDAP